MKKDKKHIKAALLEGLIELVLTLFCFGVGVCIVGAFGLDFEWSEADVDLMVLLGVVALLVVFGMVYVAVKWFKKTKKNK